MKTAKEKNKELEIAFKLFFDTLRERGQLSLDVIRWSNEIVMNQRKINMYEERKEACEKNIQELLDKFDSIKLES